MTGYTVHTGTSKKFVSGWDRVFGQEAAASDKRGKSGSAGKSVAKKKSERSQNAVGSADKKKSAPAKKKRGGR